MKNWQKQVPPYEGADAYVYFAFADGDVGRVWPIMRTLLRRGVRVWYCTGPAGSAEELLHRQERSRGAALTLLYLTDAAVADKDSKSRILVNQNRGQSILCLDPDGVDRRLSMGLREDVPHLALQSCRSAEDLEDALIRAEGFTQELFGEPTAVEQDKLLGRLSLGISLLAAALLLLAFAGYRHFGWFRPNYADEITIRDEVILDAARQAAGGGALTGEKAAQIRSLRLDELPESWEELALLPALERIELPQQALLDGETLPEGGYVIELSGGAS
ncbi:MAG: hypothetical protein IKS25_07595 [Oscillospiraceae bacterium]|nr:hypothetical protein [Oscillospiraceae bacterium]